MRYDDQKPALAVMLNLLGWLGIFLAGGLALVRNGYYTPPFPAPRIAWTEVISTAFGGILLLGFCRDHPGLAPDRASDWRDTRSPADWPECKGQNCPTYQRVGLERRASAVRIRTSSHRSGVAARRRHFSCHSRSGAVVECRMGCRSDSGSL